MHISRIEVTDEQAAALLAASSMFRERAADLIVMGDQPAAIEAAAHATATEDMYGQVRLAQAMAH